MTDLAVVEQTQLGQLTQRREELQDTIKQLRKKLLAYRNWNLEANQERHRGSCEWNAEQADRLRRKREQEAQKLEDQRFYEESRRSVVEMMRSFNAMREADNLMYHEGVIELLERHNKELDIDSLVESIEALDERIASYDEAANEPMPDFLDPKIEISNSLADAEAALETTKAEIRKAQSSLRK